MSRRGSFAVSSKTLTAAIVHTHLHSHFLLSPSQPLLLQLCGAHHMFSGCFSGEHKSNFQWLICIFFFFFYPSSSSASSHWALLTICWTEMEIAQAERAQLQMFDPACRSNCYAQSFISCVLKGRWGFEYMEHVPTVVACFNLHCFTFCLSGKKHILHESITCVNCEFQGCESIITILSLNMSSYLLDLMTRIGEIICD